MSDSVSVTADRPTSVDDLPPLVRIRCPDCGTEATVSSENSHDALETHDEKRHGGEQTAGLKIQIDDGFVVVPHPNDVVTDGVISANGTEHADPMYCSECDEMVPENWDHHSETWKCPECGATPLYEDKDEYIEVTHATARFQKERGYGPWYSESATDRSNGGDSQ